MSLGESDAVKNFGLLKYDLLGFAVPSYGKNHKHCTGLL